VSGDGIQLSPGREARRQLAVWAAFDTRDGDPDAYSQRLAELMELDARLKAEQRAELGYLPDTVEGMTAVLHVAARIVALVGDLDLMGGGSDALP
jgi:hypothetical protein